MAAEWERRGLYPESRVPLFTGHPAQLPWRGGPSALNPLPLIASFGVQSTPLNTRAAPGAEGVDEGPHRGRERLPLPQQPRHGLTEEGPDGVDGLRSGAFTVVLREWGGQR